MMLGKLLSFFIGGSGAASAVANVGKWAAMAAILVPAWQWFEGNREQVAVSFTWGQLVVVGAIIYALLEVAHRSHGPGSHG